jgi:hypothetical protein
MGTDFLDTEAAQLMKGHEDMTCRRAIGLARDRVKKDFLEGCLSEGEASQRLYLSVKDLRQCKEHRPVKKMSPRRRKGSTKVRYK